MRWTKRAVTRLLADPRLTWRPLSRQYEFLASAHPRRLLRAGNQFGKTTAGAQALIAHATGHDPYCPEMETPTASECWVICASWSQSVAVQSKLFDLLPKNLLHPETVFDPLRGFRGKNPAFRLLHKTGEWSIVRIKTTKQGGLRLATATIGFAWFDEPPESPRIYSEITKRVMRAGRYGRVILTMTPINAPVAWIQKSVELGQIEDFHARMEPDQFLFVSRDDRGQWRRTEEPVTLLDGTKCDGEWIAAQIKGTLPHEVPVVCHGEWRMMAQRAVFGAFRESGPNAHVTPDTPDSRRVVHLYVGVDHGVREFTQVAVLVAVDRADPDAPIVWVLDEYVGEYETTDEDDAIGIDEMLRRNSIEWVHLDEINGDRAHLAGGNGPSVARKSNQRLAAAMCRHLGVGELRPPILPAKRGVSSRSGSVEFGCTVLHRLMVANRFRIHPRCKVGIASIQGYDLTPNSAESHWVDALRYALRPVIWTTKATNPIDVEVG